MLDQKVKFEERLMVEKEVIHKLRVMVQGLEERNLVLRDNAACYRDRISQLEKENLDQ